MIRPVDVLAVIASRVNRFDANGNAVRDETLDDARAAVAELVEAAKEADSALELWAGENNTAADAVTAIRAALAKFGGQS